MTREEATIQSLMGHIEALEETIKALEQEPRKITYEDVKGYCKPRCLTIIDNELLYELTHPKIKALEQESILDKIRAEIKGKYRVVLKSTPKDDWAVKWNDCIDEVLQIIDKYIAGKEQDE